MFMGFDRMAPKRERGGLEDTDLHPEAKRQKLSEYSNESSSTTEPSVSFCPGIYIIKVKFLIVVSLTRRRSPSSMKHSGPPLSPAGYPLAMQHPYAAGPYAMYPASMSPSPTPGSQFPAGNPAFFASSQGRFPSPVPHQQFTSHPPQSGNVMSPIANPIASHHSQQYQYVAPPHYSQMKQAGFPPGVPPTGVFHHPHHHQQQYSMPPPHHTQYSDLSHRPPAWLAQAQEQGPTNFSRPDDPAYQQWAHSQYSQRPYPSKVYGGFPPQYPVGVTSGAFPPPSAGVLDALDHPQPLGSRFPPSEGARPASANSDDMKKSPSSQSGAAVPSSSTSSQIPRRAGSPTSASSSHGGVSLPSFQELAAQ